MRGTDVTQGSLFSYVSLEERIPKDHPLRRMRVLVDAVLRSMSDLFGARYSHTGRPSVAPEKLLRALLLQVLYTIRSGRQLMEQLDYNLLFRWFVGPGIDDPVWDRTVFCINRDRLLSEALAREFFGRVLAIAEWKKLVSEEHFSVDGTMIEAWASHKSFVKKDGSGPDKPSGCNPEVDFTGEKRSNATHQSTTDPKARLYKKGEFTEAKLRYITHALAENRQGLIVDVETTLVTGTAVDGRTARGKGYATSLKRRKMIEEAFGWLKTVGGLRKTRHKGLAKVSGQAPFCFAAYNLTRMLNLLVIIPLPSPARAMPA